MRRCLRVLICLVGFAGQADAHARLENAVPAVGGTVRTAPREVAITFSERIEPAFSTIAVTDAAGRRVDTGPPHTAPDDPRLLEVALSPLDPGIYKVVWHVVSVDTHKTQGDFSFTVAP